MTPIQPSNAWLKSLDSAITKFYWKNKTPRIKLSTLQKPKSLGGLDAPNFTPYCLANHLQYIHRWTHPNQSDITWLDLEQNLYGNFQIADLPFFTQTIKKHSCFKSPTISSSLTAWWKFHNITNTKLSHLKLTPIWNNPDFTCNNKKLNFNSWKSNRITHLQHMFVEGNFSTFEDLVQKFGITDKQFLQYLQLKSSIKSSIKLTTNTPTVNLELTPTISQIICYDTIYKSGEEDSSAVKRWFINKIKQNTK